MKFLHVSIKYLYFLKIIFLYGKTVQKIEGSTSSFFLNLVKKVQK